MLLRRLAAKCGRAETLPHTNAYIRYYRLPLQVGFPQAMLVAVFVNRKRCLATEFYGRFRRLARLEAPGNDALFGYDVYPLDVMVLFHRMSNTAYLGIQDIILNGNLWHVLFGSRIGRVRLDNAHGLLAATELTAAVDHLHSHGSADVTFVKR